MQDKITELVAKKARHAAKAKLPKNWKTPAEISTMIEDLEEKLEKAEQDLEKAEEDASELRKEQGLGTDDSGAPSRSPSPSPSPSPRPPLPLPPPSYYRSEAAASLICI